MSKIVNLFGGNIETGDDKFAPDTLLENAKGELNAMILIGTMPNGDYYFSSTTTDKGAMLFMLENFKTSLMNGDLDG